MELKKHLSFVKCYSPYLPNKRGYNGRVSVSNIQKTFGGRILLTFTLGYITHFFEIILAAEYVVSSFGLFEGE